MSALETLRDNGRVHEGSEICRLDVARSSVPVWAKTSKEPRVFFARMNNSSRLMPDGELEQYLKDRWPGI